MTVCSGLIFQHRPYPSHNKYIVCKVPSLLYILFYFISLYFFSFLCLRIWDETTLAKRKRPTELLSGFDFGFSKEKNGRKTPNVCPKRSHPRKYPKTCKSSFEDSSLPCPPNIPQKPVSTPFSIFSSLSPLSLTFSPDFVLPCIIHQLFHFLKKKIVKRETRRGWEDVGEATPASFKTP